MIQSASYDILFSISGDHHFIINTSFWFFFVWRKPNRFLVWTNQGDLFIRTLFLQRKIIFHLVWKLASSISTISTPCFQTKATVKAILPERRNLGVYKLEGSGKCVDMTIAMLLEVAVIQPLDEGYYIKTELNGEREWTSFWDRWWLKKLHVEMKYEHKQKTPTSFVVPMSHGTFLVAMTYKSVSAK